VVNFDGPAVSVDIALHKSLFVSNYFSESLIFSMTYGIERGFDKAPFFHTAGMVNATQGE